MKRFLCLFLSLLLMFALGAYAVFAREDAAADLRETLTLTRSDGGRVSTLLDAQSATSETLSAGASLFLQSETPMETLYLCFDTPAGEWLLTDMKTGQEYTCGKNGYLRECIDLSELCGAGLTECALTFSGKTRVSVSDVFAYGEGTLPDTVETWQAASGEVDLLLFATRGGDDATYFAGLLPTYTARGLTVQVAYFTSPFGEAHLAPQTLDALWSVGVRRYPVFSEYPYHFTESLDAAQKRLNNDGYTVEDAIFFSARLLRRFRPLVTVGPDLAGEESDGAYMLASYALTQALMLSGDAQYETDNALREGVFSTKRCYLHLYEETGVTSDFDAPLDAFSGKTAFEVSKEALSIYTVFSERSAFLARYDVERAADVAEYNPCRYGLYYSAEAEGAPEADFFATIRSYREQEEDKIAAEEAARQAEEDARIAEETARDEAAREEASALARSALSGKNGSTILWAGIAFVALIAVLYFAFFRGKRAPKKK